MEKNEEGSKMKNSLKELREDFKISFKFYKENWKPFVYTNFLTMILIISISFLSIFLLGLAGVIDINLLNFEISSSQPFFNVFINQDHIQNVIEPYQIAIIIGVLLLFLLVFIILVSFEGSLYGLAFEIYTSGNEFAEFKHAFVYFKKYWFKFVFLAFFFSLVSYLILYVVFLVISKINPDFIIRFLGHNNNSNGPILFILVNFMFFFVYPALIDTGSIKKAMGRNFKFIKKEFIRVILINFIFVLLSIFMRIPFFLLGYEFNAFFIILIIILSLFDFLFLKGIKILIVTRAYNSILFKKGRLENDES